MDPSAKMEKCSALFSLFEAAESLSERIGRLPPYDTALSLLAWHVKQVAFVQVGANDGTTGDALHRYIANSSWTGLLIEPHPEAFSALRRICLDAGERITLVNKAITQEQGTIELLEPDTRFGSLTATILPDSGWARS